MVVDGQTWLANLPHTIDAFFFLRYGDGTRTEFIKNLYYDFMDTYPDASTLLVSVDIWDSEPFAFVDGPTR